MEPLAAHAHACEPDADRLIERIGAHANHIRILTFWSLEATYPHGKLRYHLGQLGMLQLMRDLADRGCTVEALICDSQSRSIVGGSTGDLERDIQGTETFIRRQKNGPVKVHRMSQLIEDLHGAGDASHQVASCVVTGAQRFRNCISRLPPGEAVIRRLERFRNCVELPALDDSTAAYVGKLNDKFPSVRPLDLLAALFASVRRPKWFDAFWLGDIAAWIAKQAEEPNTVILEANRSAYSWLTHRCFLAIGALGNGNQPQEPPWPAMYFVDPILCIDGKAPMQLSARPQAIFLHHTHNGLKDRLARASPASLASYRQWFKPHSADETDDSLIREALLSRIESLRTPVNDLLTRAQAEASKTSSPPDKIAIGVCLSGGGLRATFFHLGLVKLLRDLDLLKKVVGVYSVSGGSILAANLALRWADYTKDQEDETFFEAMRPLHKFAQANIRGRIVRRLFCFGSRAERLAGYYDNFVGLTATELKDLPSELEFSFLGTSMKTGKLVAFTRKGYHNGSRLFASTDLSLARAVAASSAFPPMFPPIWLSAKDLRVDPDGKEGVGPVTDGGVYDNLGLTKLMSDAELRADERWCTVALVSDASAPFEVSGGAKFKWMFSRTARATDIMMKRVGELEAAGQADLPEAEDGWMEIPPIKVKIDGSIGAEIMDQFPDSGGDYCVQDDRVQALTSKIRTDLDNFSNEEVASLMRHGYEMGLVSLMKAGMVPQSFQPRDPCGVPFPRLDILGEKQPESPSTDKKAAVQRIRDHLEHSDERRLGIFNSSGWLRWVVLGALFLALA